MYKNVFLAGGDPSWPFPLLALHHTLHPCCLCHIFTVSFFLSVCLFVYFPPYTKTETFESPNTLPIPCLL